MQISGLVALCVLVTPAPPETRLYEGLGSYRRPVGTKISLAANYITQGFAALYGFDYFLAKQSFSEAVRLDPNLVIGYWGIAASYGNNINEPEVSPEDSRKALDALKRARSLQAQGTPEENDLVEAAFARFSVDGPKDRASLDTGYSDAMRKVWAKYPNDPDVGALFAESILDTRPWNQWTREGRPQPGTEEALATIRSVLKLNGRHPQGLHLWIHTMEGSQHPELALSEASKLLDLQPGLDHMQHMPAHIFNRTGRWAKSIEANTKSIAVFHRLSWKEGAYLDYAHARHSLAYAAAMKGQSELALHNASKIFDGLSDEVLKKAGSDGDFYAGMRIMFLLRFGRWQDVLAMPEPLPIYPYAGVMRHEARAVAFAAEKKVEAALQEQQRFLESKAALLLTTKDEDTKAVLNVAEHLMRGEILVAQHQFDPGILELKQAVKAEDTMPYSEPPSWIQPTRHTLGAVLIQAKNFKEAERVYSEDLSMHPNNGWDLFGLYRAYQGLHQDKNARNALTRFQKAWSEADMTISSSCACMPSLKP